MADLKKPLAKKIGNHYEYTLSSYDPVSIEVTVPAVTDLDEQIGLEMFAHNAHISVDEINDKWVEDFSGGHLHELDELKFVIRQNAEEANAQHAEDMKEVLCADKLAERLEQEVPEEEIKSFVLKLREAMAYDMQENGMDMDEYLKEVIGEKNVDDFFRDGAIVSAHQQAALLAFAKGRKIQVQEDELAPILGIPANEAADFIKEVKGHGQIDDAMTEALLQKAAKVAASECHCSYRHCSKEETEANEQEKLMLLKEIRKDNTNAAHADSGFKLV